VNDVKADRPVAVITGTSRGIGDTLARYFLAQDYHVVGCSRSDHPDLRHPDYRHEIADVGSEVRVAEMFRDIRRTYGRLDVAINNAVDIDPPTQVALTSAASVGKALSTCVVGPFVVCREATKLMMRRRFGRIISIGSMATAHAIEGSAVYAAAKAAVNALTLVHAREVARYGITCNVVAPASAKTDLLDVLSGDRLERTLEHNSLHEVGSPDDVAELVGWLASPKASTVTGQIVYLGGA
jgi:3-oxoacyl-[acyl-carrier protein] reductase